MNKAKNPNENNIGVVNRILPPYRVANQEKILIPVGTAIIIVAAVKYARVSTNRLLIINNLGLSLIYLKIFIK